MAVLTGDTLFIGDVGRPDLLVAADVPAEVLGADLYRSVHRLLGLPDPTLVLPGHGAGSACGKALSTETVSTIGEQRRTNYALQPMPVDAFVDLVTELQPAAPAYFGHDAGLNRRGHALLASGGAPARLDLEAVDRAVAAGAVVIDTRPPEEFAAGHLAGWINVSLGGRFAEQVGSLVPFGSAIVLAGDERAATEGRIRLARIGFDEVVGFLDDPLAVVAAHPDRAEQLSRLTSTQLAERRAALGERLQLVDVRNPGEVEAAPLADARNIPLASLRARLDEIDPREPVVVVCAGGARSAVASSLLRAMGFSDVSDVLGGVAALGVAASCATASRP